MKKLLFCFPILLQFLACKNRDADKYKERLSFKESKNQFVYKKTDYFQINIDNSDTSTFNLALQDSLSQPLLLHKIIDSEKARVINLGKRASVFRSADKIIFSNNVIYIFDWKVSHDIFQFDFNGNYLKNYRGLKKVYGITNPVDFDVKLDTVFIVDQSAKLWVIDNKKDKLIAEFNLPFIAQGIRATSTSEILVYNGSPEYNKNLLLKMNLTDTSIIASAIPIKKDYLSFDVNQFPFSVGMHNSTLFMPAHCDTIYRLTNDTISPAFVFNFGSMGIPLNFYGNEKLYKENYLHYRRRLNFFTYESEKYFTTTVTDKVSLWSVFDKQNRTTTLYKSVGDNLLAGAINKFPIGLKGDSLVFSVDRVVLNSFLENNSNKLVRTNLISQLIDASKDKNEYNNPILIITPWK